MTVASDWTRLLVWSFGLSRLGWGCYALGLGGVYGPPPPGEQAEQSTAMTAPMNVLLFMGRGGESRSGYCTDQAVGPLSVTHQKLYPDSRPCSGSG